MAAPAPAPAACPVLMHFPNGSLLIRDIAAAQLVPGFTFYEVLRLPMYKPYTAHVINHALVTTSLTNAACTCPGRPAALAAFNAAWANISANAATKLAYDNGINAIPPPPLPNVSASIPRRAGAFPSINLPRAIPINGWFRLDSQLFRNGTPLTPEFKNVEFRPSQIFRKIQPKRLFARHRQYSFWTSLSLALYDDEKYWAEIKETVRVNHLNFMIVPPVPVPVAEPRAQSYADLDLMSFWSGFPLPLGPGGVPLLGPGTVSIRPSVTRGLQLQPDNNYGGVPPGLQVYDVTPETWQVVADILKIELIVIHGHIIPAGTNPVRRVITPRGDHGNRQVFLFYEEDGECRAVRPVVEDPFSYRFDFHMPHRLRQRPRNPTPGQQADDYSDLRRCPFVTLDQWGISEHLYPKAAPLGITPRAVPYMPPFVPPEPLIHDANVEIPMTNNVYRHLATGCVPRRWI